MFFYDSIKLEANNYFFIIIFMFFFSGAAGLYEAIEMLSVTSGTEAIICQSFGGLETESTAVASVVITKLFYQQFLITLRLL